MAYDYFQQQQDDEQNPNQAGSQQQQLGQESAIVTGNQPAAAAGGEKASSGSFTNLNSYLDANRSQQFGQQVAGRVGSQVAGAESAQTQAEQGFKSAADQGSVSNDQNLIDTVRSKPQDADVDAFAKLRDAHYAGPNTLSDRADLYQPAQQATDKAYTTAEQTKDEGGRKAFLQQEYGAGAGRYDYSRGQQKLDNLLIQQDPDAVSAFDTVQKNATAAKDRFGTLSSALDQYATGKHNETDQTRAAARGAIGIEDSGNYLDDAPVKQLYGTVQQRAAAAASQRDAEYQTYLQSLKAGRLSDEQYSKTGLTRNAPTWGVDPTSFWHQGAAPSINSVASADEQARAAALSRLASKDNTFLPDASEVGTYDPKKANSYDLNSYLSSVNSSKAAIEPKLQERTVATNYINDLESRLARLDNQDTMTDIEIFHSTAGVQDLLKGLESLGIDANAIARNKSISPSQVLRDAIATQKSRLQAANAGIPSNYASKLG